MDNNLLEFHYANLISFFARKFFVRWVANDPYSWEYNPICFFFYRIINFITFKPYFDFVSESTFLTIFYLTNHRAPSYCEKICQNLTEEIIIYLSFLKSDVIYSILTVKEWSNLYFWLSELSKSKIWLFNNFKIRTGQKYPFPNETPFKNVYYL